MSARRSVLATLIVLLGSLLAACGSDDSSSSSSPTSSPSTSDAGSEAPAESVFPVTVTHEFGETTVEDEPTRVVTVGVTEQDVVLQLGVVPVGVTEWYGDQPFATWPWAQELLGDAEPEVLSVSDGFEFERIAALQPDLIVGTNAGITKKDYALLSQIAPTVASPAGANDFFAPWQDQTLLIAQSLGLEAEGQALIDDLDGRFAEIAAAHPEWADMTATFSQGGPYDGLLYVYPAGLATEFLTDLGFTMTEGLEGYAPEIGSQAEISAENVNLIDADLIVFATESQEQFDDLQGFGTISSLGAVAEGRAAYTDETLAGAIYFLTPLSLDYVLDQLVPTLELATAGEAPREYPA